MRVFTKESRRFRLEERSILCVKKSQMEVKSPNFCVTAYMHPVKLGFNHICLFRYAPYWFVPVIAYKQVVSVFQKLNLEHICHTILGPAAEDLFNLSCATCRWSREKSYRNSDIVLPRPSDQWWVWCSRAPAAVKRVLP